MNTELKRILDANLNRAKEGLRVAEEYTRMVLNDSRLSSEVKKLRHQLQNIFTAKELALFRQTRDSVNDPGAGTRETGAGKNNPEDIAGLLKFLPEYDMVVGARPNTGQASLSRALGNKIYNWFASYVAKFQIKDLTSGFRAIRSSIAQNFLYLLPNTYSYPTTLTLGVLRSGMSVKYVPITIRKRKTGQSKRRL